MFERGHRGRVERASAVLAGIGLGLAAGAGVVVAEPPVGSAPPRGTLGREVIREVIRRDMVAVRRCYEVGLAQQRELTGQVTLSFVVGETGSVTTVAVASSTLQPEGPAASAVAECVVARARTWVFPPPTGGGSVLVNYPFVFEST